METQNKIYADLVVISKIYTANSNQDYVEAFAVKDGKYQENYFDWVSSTISQNMFYSVYYESYAEIDAPVRALY